MEAEMLNLLNIVLGGALLIAGRKIFWLFVGAIGFVIGIEIATRFFHGSELIMILAGLALGVIFAGLAVFVESIAIALAGFLGGGYVLLSVATILGLDKGMLTGIAFIMGGILGVILVVLLFDWALISISSLAGAAMVVRALPIAATTAGLVYLGLFLAGVLIQGSVLRNERRVTNK
jgi:hypothetical protein